MTQQLSKLFVIKIRAAAMAVACVTTIATGAMGYNPVTPVGTLEPGDARVISEFDRIHGRSGSVLKPQQSWGKEYVNNRNIQTLDRRNIIGRLDEEQILLWDGQGNTVDGRDYTNTRDIPSTAEDEIDAIAYSRDALFADLTTGRTAIAFSYDDLATGLDLSGNWTSIQLPSTGPVGIGGQTFGGAGELTVGKKSSANFSRWATTNAVDGPSTTTSRDVSGVEIWGPEFDGTPESKGDADKYSLEFEAASTWSIWNADGSGYLKHSKVVDAVVELLGPLTPHGLTDNDIDVDALMVRDLLGSTNSWGECSTPLCLDLPTGVDQEGKSVQLGPGPTFALPDSIIFSIDQLDDGQGSYYATGSELFVLHSNGFVNFLDQGGHVWDKNFALSNLTIDTGTYGVEAAVININALEAIGEVVTPSDIDGGLNGDDFLHWQSGFGVTGGGVQGGDFNGDGSIDSADLDVWHSLYGASTGGGIPQIANATMEIPEPATVCMAILAVCMQGTTILRVRCTRSSLRA